MFEQSFWLGAFMASTIIFGFIILVIKKYP